MEESEAKLNAAYYFRRNAFTIIEEVVKLNTISPEHTTLYVDEVLHSIFFLGKIKNCPRYTPQMIVNDDEIYDALKKDYPRAFDLYSSQLPKRSPFSCVLDMIVHLEGQQNEDLIIKRLQQLISRLKEDKRNELVPSTICVSQKSNIQNSDRYYGVSMSTKGPNPGQIVVAASCCSIWDDYVAGAVMTYYPEKKKKTYFDGTIKLPADVRCQAFSLFREEPMPPCRSCANMFGLQTTEKTEWAYGNCAEVESVSNLFKKENDVKEKAQPTSPTWTDENRTKARANVEKELKRLLGMVQFKEWDGNYYTPQTNYS
ncbi:uncharacterized protein LOC128373941 [Scomber japonicus]|uniref:uncharacterized protein LOC128373941 n=1 Tax=Scomber japonicus TaxID=13676 RepID=UPI002306D3CC|nr:uncharacterized protein LOC128373941 [Scomber japonicus]